MAPPPAEDAETRKTSRMPAHWRASARRWARFPLAFAASRSGMTRGDFAIGASGLALGVACALFPWYIFLNQEKFGPPSVTFEGSEVEAVDDAGGASPVLPRGDADVRIIGIPDLDLDFSPTGTVPRPFSPAPEGDAEQPFPEGDGTPFKILHITAGRAMVEDDTGIWVVGRGSTLPDRTRVEKVERRDDGRWVVVTSGGKVIEAAE